MKIKPKKGTAQISTQRYLDISEIHDDTVVLKNGSIRAVLEVTALNFNLKSQAEQNAIIYSYQNFLNSLEFPIQISIKSRKMDVDEYIKSLKQYQEKQSNELLKQQTQEYINYISRLVSSTNIMEKKFYIIVGHEPARSRNKSMWKLFLEKVTPDDTVVEIIKRKKEFVQLQKELLTRVNVVETGLRNCGLRIQKLNTSKLIQLYYRCYNPDVAGIQKMDNAEKMAIDGNPGDDLTVA